MFEELGSGRCNRESQGIFLEGEVKTRQPRTSIRHQLAALAEVDVEINLRLQSGPPQGLGEIDPRKLVMSTYDSENQSY